MTFSMILTLIAFCFVCIALSWKKIPTNLGLICTITVLWLAGVLTAEEAWGNFIGNTVLSTAGMIVVGAALQKTSLLDKIAAALSRAKGGERMMVACAMLFPFVMCQFMPATPALVVCLPMLAKLAEHAGISKKRMILPAALGAQLGIGFFPIGMSAVLFLQKNEFLSNLGSSESMNIMDICTSRIPGAVAAMLFVILIGYKLLPQDNDGVTISENEALEKSLKSGMERWKELAVYVIFIGTVVAMFFNRALGLTAGQIAITAALLCVLIGALSGQAAVDSLTHSPVVMIGCMLSMATALTKSGVGDIIAEYLGGMIGNSDNIAVVVGGFFLVCAVLTQVLENGGLVNILTPLAILACMNNGVSALPVICAIELSSITAIMTPMASATAATAFGAGNYTIKQAVKFGLPVILIEMLVSIIWMPIYFGV